MATGAPVLLSPPRSATSAGRDGPPRYAFPEQETPSETMLCRCLVQLSSFILDRIAQSVYCLSTLEGDRRSIVGLLSRLPPSLRDFVYLEGTFNARDTRIKK